jgi:hypothetical protein
VSSRRLTGVVLTLPLVLMTVVLLEDLVTYKVRQHVRDIHLRVAVIVALNGVLFAAAATWLVPFLKAVLTRVRQSSRRGLGAFGLWAFYAAAYGLLYWAYLIAERRGSAALLPAALR